MYRKFLYFGGEVREKIQSYVIQGDFLRLIAEEDSNLTWKIFLWGVPRGVARFAINAGLNTLPHADNLKRWGMRTSDLSGLQWTGETDA